MGRFIVIEGLDGSGKTTQGKLLAERLRKEGKRVRELSFPCYGEKSASLVEMYLGGELGENVSSINPYAASSFFAVDRVASYIKEWKDYGNSSCLSADGSNYTLQIRKMIIRRIVILVTTKGIGHAVICNVNHDIYVVTTNGLVDNTFRFA